MRFARIDVLRALAAVTVVCYHILGVKFGWHPVWNSSGVSKVDYTSARSVFASAVSMGWASVPLFFAISGFCIHAAFLKQKSFHLGKFLWSRFWRIYPPFLAVIFLFCFWPMPRLGVDTTGEDLLEVISTLFVFSNDTFWSKLNPSFWSVAVEFQCYLLYPLLLLLRQKFGITRVVLGWVGIAAIGRLAAGAIFGWPDHAINYWSCFSLFSFGDWALGALVAEYALGGRRHIPYERSAFALAIAACYLSTFWRPSITLSFSFAAVAGALLISIYANRQASTSRIEAMAVKFGLVSYSLYLWHQPILGVLVDAGRDLSAGLPIGIARLLTYVFGGLPVCHCHCLLLSAGATWHGNGQAFPFLFPAGNITHLCENRAATLICTSPRSPKNGL